MVNGVKEFSYIALKCVALASVVFARFSKHVRNFLHSLVSTFVDAARVRFIYKSWFEYFIKHRKSSVMKYSISDNRFIYSSDLRIMYPKSLVWPMLVRFIFQISEQVKNVLFKIQLKFRNIRFVLFIGLEYLPSPE